ncbi:hypothetical protein PMAYCL1PPCAC_06110, partial [Pristionchus mayeri]
SSLLSIEPDPTELVSINSQFHCWLLSDRQSNEIGRKRNCLLEISRPQFTVDIRRVLNASIRISSQFSWVSDGQLKFRLFVRLIEAWEPPSRPRRFTVSLERNVGKLGR